MNLENKTEVTIIGGSYSGLSAALALGNSLRRTIVIDAGTPRNALADEALNLLGNNRVHPMDFLHQAKRDINTLHYVRFINDVVETVTLNSECNEFSLHLKKGQTIVSKKIIWATGVLDVLPSISGIEPFWPYNIFQCPYCIGYTVRDQPLAVYSTEEEVYTLALIIHKWTKDFIVLTDGSQFLSEEQMKQLNQLGVKIFSQKISHVSGRPHETFITHLEDGQRIERRGIFMHLKFHQRAKHIMDELGCEYTEDRLVKVDEFFRTTVNHVYAIGDAALKIQKLSTAIASGTVAAIAIDRELTMDKFDR